MKARCPKRDPIVGMKWRRSQGYSLHLGGNSSKGGLQTSEGRTKILFDSFRQHKNMRIRYNRGSMCASKTGMRDSLLCQRLKQI